MYQTSMNLYLCLQHLKVRSSKFLQLDHLYRISLMYLLNLHTLIDLAAVTFTQLILRGIFIDTHLHLGFFQGVQLLKPLLLRVVSRERLKFNVVVRDLTTIVPHHAIKS